MADDDINEMIDKAPYANKDSGVIFHMVEHLAKLDPVQYDQEREEKAKELGIRVATLDDEVKKHRKSRGENLKGEAVELWEPETWHEPVAGDAVLNELVACFEQFLVMPEGVHEVLALWAVQAHTYEAFQHSPRLNVCSPEMGCGKTTVLDVMECLVPRGIRSESASTPVMFRLIDANKPTLLLDEVETFLLQDEELRGAINAGHRRGGRHLRCVGDDHDVRAFKTFGPVVLAGIGQLKGTIADRSIRIPMQRKLPNEVVEDFKRVRHEAGLHKVANRVARWAADNFNKLCDTDPKLPSELFNRMADNWRPLIAIADRAGGDWPETARKLAVKFSCSDGQDEASIRVQLLVDLEAIFTARNTIRLMSATICEALAEMEDKPWPEWRNGKPITTRQLASLLKAFEIKPKTIRMAAGTAKGYELEAFDSAFARYLPNRSVTPSQVKEAAACSPNRSVTSELSVTDENSPEPAENSRCYGVTDENPEIGEKWEVSI
jgi:hypothetical protein